MQFLTTGYSLCEWQARLAQIYENKNQQRRPIDLWRRMARMCAGMARAAESKDKDGALKFMPRFHAWMFGLATRVDIDLETVVWENYPRCCPRCEREVGCVCSVPGQERKSRKGNAVKVAERAKQLFETKPTTLCGWFPMFNKIYGGINSDKKDGFVTTHLFEEVFELEEELEHFNNRPASKRSDAEILDGIKREISDVFAWSSALINELGLGGGEYADAALKELYLEACNECHKPVCECAVEFVYPKNMLTASDESDRRSRV